MEIFYLLFSAVLLGITFFQQRSIDRLKKSKITHDMNFLQLILSISFLSSDLESIKKELTEIKKEKKKETLND